MADIEEIELPTMGETSHLRGHTSLYTEATRTQYLNSNLMSTGEAVDAVLVWQLPDDKEERQQLLKEVAGKRGTPVDSDSPVANFFFREYFESMLTNALVKQNLQEVVQQLNSTNDAAKRKELEDKVKLLQRQIASRTLKLETELGEDSCTVFVKIHAPFETLLHVAEEVQLVLPLIPSGRVNKPEPPSLYERMYTLPGLRWLTVPDVEEDGSYCGEFKLSAREKFINHDKQDLLFSAAQRTMLVFRILQQARYERSEADASNAERFGIERMVRKGIYTAAFPLHDAAIDEPPATSTHQERYLLASTWGTWTKWYKTQPLLRVRRYFGEKIAFYFLWLGFYTRLLVPAGIVGLAIFIYGLGTYKNQDDANELCSTDLLMCGQCSTCNKWNLKTACSAYEFSWVFDNGGTVLFSFFMALWATFFTEFWKRETAAKSYEWDVSSFEENEPLRPAFRPHGVRPDPVTNEPTPYFSSGTRRRRYIASGILILLMLTLVIWAVIAVIVFRLAIRVTLYNRYENLQNSAAAITSVLAAILNLITILILNIIYEKLAIALTDWENHERQTEHEQALTLKVSLFQFVNSYASIFYIAYFKGQFVGRPGDRGELFGIRDEDCPEYGCMLELTIQLAIIMVGKQVFGNFVEVILPWLKQKLGKTFRRWRMAALNSKVGDAEAEEEKPIATNWERQFLLLPYESQFHEYLEMVIQFGFVTLFVAAFPLAPLCALLNNMVELRLDAGKLIHSIRRPFAERCEDIGVWEQILTIISYCAVVTNAFVIAIPSSFIPKLVYYYRNDRSLKLFINASYAPSTIHAANNSDADCYYKGYRNADGSYSTLHYEIMMARLAFVICFEHAVFLAKIFFAWLIPDVPKRVALAIKREEHEVRLAFETALLGPSSSGVPAVIVN